MSIYVCGDIHGGMHLDKLYSYNWDVKLSDKDYLIILGDFGVFYSPEQTKQEQKVLRFLFQLPCNVMFIDGNHENFDALEQLPKMDKFGGKVQYIKEDENIIWYLQRGEVYTIDGKTIFTFGGALSVDKIFREEYISWWSQEKPTTKQFDNGLANLKRVGNKVDYILSHTCPESIYNKMDRNVPNYEAKRPDIAMRVLEAYKTIVDYKAWHFGHFHVSMKIADKHYCHFQDSPVKLV